MAYTSSMRRIQIYIEEELDERLGAAAARGGVSKAALIRDAIARVYTTGAAPSADPLDRLVGALDIEPSSIDGTVYGPPRAATAARTRRRGR